MSKIMGILCFSIKRLSFCLLLEQTELVFKR